MGYPVYELLYDKSKLPSDSLAEHGRDVYVGPKAGVDTHKEQD